MSNVTALKSSDDLSLDEKTKIILDTLYPNDIYEIEELFRVFIDPPSNKGKIYLPLCQSIGGLVNTPVRFPLKVEIRENMTVIYF